MAKLYKTDKEIESYSKAIDLIVTEYLKRAIEITRNNGLEKFTFDVNTIALMIQKEELSNKN
jgi:uncharacterized radical SAM superfamily protein